MPTKPDDDPTTDEEIRQLSQPAPPRNEEPAIVVLPPKGMEDQEARDIGLIESAPDQGEAPDGTPLRGSKRPPPQ